MLMLVMIEQSDASTYCMPLSAKAHVSSRPKRLPLGNLLTVLSALFAFDKLPYYILVALLTQVELTSGLHPLGIGFAAACLLLRDPALNLGMMGWLAAGVAFGNMRVLPVYLILYTLFWIFAVVLKANWKDKMGQYAFAVGVTVTMLQGIPPLAGGSPPYVILSVVIHGLLTGVSCLLFVPGVAAIKTRSLPFGVQEFISLLLIGLGALMGIGNLQVFGVALVYVISGLAILTAGYIGGPGAAAVLGTTIGVGLMLPLAGPPLLLASLGFPGTVAGVFRHKARGWMVFGFLVSQLLLYLSLAPTLVGEMGATLLAALLFLIIPQQVLHKLQRFLPVQYQQANVQEVASALQDSFADKLSGMSRVFEELASTFGDDKTPEESRHSQLNRACEYISEKACASCVSYRKCWEENFYQTYWDLVELLASVEHRRNLSTRDLPPRFQKYCLHAHRLTATLREAAERLRINNYWGQRVSESRGIVRRQLAGVSQLIKGVAAQFEIGLCEDLGLQQILKEQFTVHELFPAEVLITDEGGVRRVTIERQRLCHGAQFCSNRIPALMDQVLGESYSVWQRFCSSEGRCRCVFLPERKFNLETVALNVPKDTVSGDEWTKLMLPNGKIALLISDGMGIGPEAAKESQATVSMLERMLENGFDVQFALQTVNSVLLLRSVKETFATIDLALVDMYTGLVDFIKIGSTPSFIVRPDEVEIVRANSLPVGIFPEIEIQSQTRRLEHGDILVMITDGAIDQQSELLESEQWIAELLARIKTDDPGKIARRVLDELRQVVGEQLPDDVTIVVTRITRATPNHQFYNNEEIPLYVRVGQ